MPFEKQVLLGLLKLTCAKLNDEALLELSKIGTLRQLILHMNEGRTTSRGWLQLANLRNLELLKLPVILVEDWRESNEIIGTLKARLPNTVFG